MKILVGLFLIVISFFGTIYFRSYRGSVIPYPVLWYIGFFVAGFVGVLLIYLSIRRVKRVMEDQVTAKLGKFKANAEKIELEFDKCEFNGNSYSHQLDDPNVSTAKALAGTPGFSVDTTITENVIQSYLVYSDTIDGELVKFISQSFPFDQTTLQFYVLRHNITLYVDRFDRREYCFELIR